MAIGKSGDKPGPAGPSLEPNRHFAEGRMRQTGCFRERLAFEVNSDSSAPVTWVRALAGNRRWKDMILKCFDSLLLGVDDWWTETLQDMWFKVKSSIGDERSLVVRVTELTNCSCFTPFTFELYPVCFIIPLFCSFLGSFWQQTIKSYQTNLVKDSLLLIFWFY